MLKLKRVELQGFKSFCDRTEMRFNGAGIAAVVGPNGCGKSNLSDAISWVLGEQSAKSLRGSRMMDVIFAGTTTRKPLGMATVTMTLVDPGYHLPQTASEQIGLKSDNGTTISDGSEVVAGGTNGHAANGHANGHANGANGVSGPGKPREITITRRLYRSGESDYLIDGKLARLRDIQDLFMGTGLGPESYAIIEQGRIGQILSSRPQDRRAVIEEAAGISKFKSRRRLAEAKLEGARQNLSRVFDILEEVSRQVNSLNRQAKKAERYKRLHEQMVVQLRRTLAGRFRVLERDATKTALQLNEATVAFHELTKTVAAKEQGQRSAQQKAYGLEAQLTETRNRLAETKIASERTRGRMEAQGRQASDIELRLTQGETETQSLETRSKELEAQLEAHAQTLADLEVSTNTARETLNAKTSEREAAGSDLRQREQALETARKTVLLLLGEAAQLKNELTQIDEYVASVDRDSARTDTDKKSAAEETERLEGVRKETGEKLGALRGGLASVTEERTKVETELGGRRTRIAEERQRLEELRDQTAGLRARKNSLDEILSHRAYTTDSVKSFFTATEQGRQHAVEPLGVLADFVDVDPNYEKAAEEFLHDELEYILVKSWSQAQQGVELMRSDLEGRATFLVHPEPDLAFGTGCPEPPIGPETGIATRLSCVLRMTNGLTHAPTELVPRIARCMIAEDHASAQRLAQQYPDYYFLLEDGVCYHGYAVSGGKKSSAGPLALKRELRELTSTLQGRERQLEEAARLVQTLDAEINSFSEQLEKLRADQQSREKEVLSIEHETRKLDEELTRATHRLKLANEELTRLGGEKGRVATQREQFLTSVAAKELARQTQEGQLEETRGKLDELQKQVTRLTEEHSALRVELAEREERRRSEQAAQHRLQSQRGELQKRLEQVSGEMERLGVERARLLEDNIDLDKQSGELTLQLGQVGEAVASLEKEETELREALAKMEEALVTMRAAVQEAQERRSHIEVVLAESRSDRKHLEETCIKELKLTLHELSETEKDELDEEALADAESEYDRIRERIESLGAVNPAALEEYEEAKERYDFLNAQRQDLLDSIRDTEKAIRDIDTETKKRFSVAFEKINENFKHTFQTLFGGGMGEMRLGDPTNPGDSGIDVVASPPGKRLQNVLLLSGGEKALTALALLMAIFQYQPSPFCILDEVDAPLDEANIQRMLRLIRGMAGQTQFILITHAKSTMSIAESLYGVTMQEPGVSKLVSVKFQPAEVNRPPVERVMATSPS